MCVYVAAFRSAGQSGDAWLTSLNVQFLTMSVLCDVGVHPSQQVSKRGCEERRIPTNRTSSSWSVDEQKLRRETLRASGAEEEEEDVSEEEADVEEEREVKEHLLIVSETEEDKDDEDKDDAEMKVEYG